MHWSPSRFSSQAAMWLAVLTLFVASQTVVNADQCGEMHCIDEPGVYCANNTCKCPPDTIGKGHIHCADPTTRAVCIVYGDPHMLSFSLELFRLSLPCHHILADFVTPGSAKILQGCRVIVTGRSTYVDERVSTITSYERVVHLIIRTNANEYRAIFGKDGINWEELVELEGYKMYGNAGHLDLSSGINVNEFVYVNAKVCDVYIKFRYHDGVLSIDKPLHSVGDEGLCGHTQAGLTASSATFPSAFHNLRRTLDALSNESPVDRRNPNIYDQCSTLTIAQPGCAVIQKSVAAAFCGIALTDTKTNTCLVSTYTLTETLSRFHACFNSVCSSKTPCTIVSVTFGTCQNQKAVQTYVKARC